MTNDSRVANRQAWIVRFEQAGQIVAQFCEAEGVSSISIEAEHFLPRQTLSCHVLGLIEEYLASESMQSPTVGNVI